MIKLLDWERALDNVDGSEDLLLELAQLFIDTCPGMLNEIREAIGNRDAAALQRTAHNLKGSARIFAAGGAVEEALRLEEMGAASEFDQADECFPHLEREVMQLSTALSERIAGAAAAHRKGP